MQPNNIKHIAKNLGGVFSENSPLVLTSIAVGGVISTAVLAIKATPKALQLLAEEQKYREENGINGEYEEITKLDTVRICWRCYIPTGGIILATSACIIGAHSVHTRRNAALATVYGLTEAAFKKYQSKVADTLGTTKEQRVRDEISADNIRKNSPGSAEIIFTGKGEVLCYDTISGRYFKSDIETIRRIRNDLNARLLSEMFISLNDLYYELGLGNTKLGDEMGWNMDNGWSIDFNYSSQLTDNGEPCLVLDYVVAPRFNYGI